MVSAAVTIAITRSPRRRGRLRPAARAGIGKDDKVILYGENRPEWIIALWGCLLEGVIAVPIDYRSSPEFVERIDHIVEARAILTGDEVSLPESPRSGNWPV